MKFQRKGEPTLKQHIAIFDTTLRDGSQAESISYSLQDKLHIVRALDNFGVTYIEAGNPASNPKDLHFFEMLKENPPKHAKLCAFGATVHPFTPAEKDKNLQSLLAAETPAVAVVGKASAAHVTEILQIDKDENLRMVKDTVAYLKAAGREVIFDAEHFFDGVRVDADYALAVLAAANEAGADVLCLCDTNGGTLPEELKAAVAVTKAAFPEATLGIHCHNDSGCAVAATLSAVDAGVTHVQGTFLGLGERCGNAALTTVIGNLTFKCDCDCGVKLGDMKRVAGEIAEISNIRMQRSMPYVGKCAFAHKGGMHVDAVMKMPSSFEHIEPSQVGNERRFLLSEVAGRGTVLPRLHKYAPELTKQSPETAAIVEEVKQREYAGYQYEGADASFELLVKRFLGKWKPHFNVIMYKLSEDFPAPDGERQSTAVIKIEVDGKTQTAGAMGIGPLHALDTAMREALTAFYPEIGELRMSDYKVRVIETNKATDATTRVLMETTDGAKNVFVTVGVSTDVVEASFIALVDAFEYALSRNDK